MAGAVSRLGRVQSISILYLFNPIHGGDMFI
jgi:hypothetical protein